MKYLDKTAAALVVLGLLAGCGTITATPSNMLTKVPVDVTAAPDNKSETASLNNANWVTTPLVNVSTGETFKLSDYKGKVLLVEMMAVWCTNCLQQQGQVRQLHQNATAANSGKVISISMDVDPNEDARQVKAYREKQGFEWGYTVAPSAVAREISQLYGPQFLNPSAVPMLIIDKQGVAHPLPFGVKSVESLQDALKPYL
ncbi:MAG TPA: TlpA disulfide reductase family protein [Anaerolineae bacterium]|jgi:thiol-disulfide isomerase/thioredoxin